MFIKSKQFECCKQKVKCKRKYEQIEMKLISFWFQF